MTWILKTHAENSFCEIFGGILVQMNDFTLLKVEHMPLGKHLLTTGTCLTALQGAKRQAVMWANLNIS